MFAPTPKRVRPELAAALSNTRAALHDLRASVEGALPREAHIQQVTIAPLTDQEPIVTPAARGSAGTSRPRRFSSLSAAWAKFRDIEQRFSDSIWGDVLGGISLVIFAISALFIAWGMQ
ncbi:hypothetical protein [Salipiger thiooxidans]|uniref:hypothetical protein n=1 Tax=Salipiger thiooxidans TaxID=282683 RepID=UPI001CFA47D8|nr:hypothetical protein [Salipiger thiooxidans]